MKKTGFVDGIEIADLPKRPKNVHCPWFHFVALLLLGEWTFVHKSFQRIKEINTINYKHWLRTVEKLVEKKKEEIRVKKQQEEEQKWDFLRRGGGNVAVGLYALPSSYYVAVGQGGNVYVAPSTGNPWIYNGQIVQWNG
jgi:hypothetical protein